MTNPTDNSNHADSKALDTAMAKLRKQYGPCSIQRWGERQIEEVDAISTGSLALDLAMGIGGFPRGRVVEIYGPEASGKTTLALHALASCQAQGGTAAIVDAEHALDAKYAESLGINMETLLVSQPDDGEQGLDVVEQLVSSGAVTLVVVDSVAALVPRAELEGDMGDMPVGLQARLMSQALRKLTGVASRTNTTVIFINQLRQKIGVTFGSGEVTTGGNALKYYCSIRLDVRRIATLKKDNQAYGNRTRVKVVKNKLAPPFRQVEFDILYGQGISSEGELLDTGEEHGLVTRSGSWYAFGDVRLGQGRENSRARLMEEPALAAQLRQAILVASGLGGDDEAAA